MSIAQQKLLTFCEVHLHSEKEQFTILANLILNYGATAFFFRFRWKKNSVIIIPLVGH